MIDCQKCIHETVCKETCFAKEFDKKISELNQNNLVSFIAESKCPNFYEKRRTRG